jgi:transposase
MGGERSFVLAGERDWLLVRLIQKPDPTLHALLAELRQRGAIVAGHTLWRFLRREEIS